MFLNGISDEAGKPLDVQIRAHKELGWKHLELRTAGIGEETANIHDLSEAAFEKAAEMIDASGLHVYCFASTIANWGKSVLDPFEPSLEEARRAIPRMKRLKTPFVRVMSFKVLDEEDQREAERFRRLRELVKMFGDEGLSCVHENCMNYGGMGWKFTLRLLEEVPGLKLVFDTGNPVFAADRMKEAPYPRQSAWEFYEHVRDHVVYVHIKDGVWNDAEQKVRYCYPGEGQGDVARIVKDLAVRGYEGGLSIEPHMTGVFHDASVTSPEDQQYRTYIEYGWRMEALLDEALTVASK